MHRLDRERQALAIGLAGLAGWVDAVGFLSADGYFVSFMSGNSTRLGVNLAQHPHRAIVPALLIAGFVAGVAAGTVVGASWGGPEGRRRKPAVVGLVSLLLLGAAVLRHWPALLGGSTAVALALLVGAMGALNTTFQRDGEVAVGLTYMTGALVRLGQALGAALLGQRRSGWLSNLGLWAALAVGAVLGAWAQLHLGAPALALAAAWSLVMLGFAVRLTIRRSRAPDDQSCN